MEVVVVVYKVLGTPHHHHQQQPVVAQYHHNSVSYLSTISSFPSTYLFVLHYYSSFSLGSAVGSLFTTALGASGKDRSGLTYDKSYATMNSVPHYSSGLGGVGGGASSQYTSHKQHSPRLGGSGRSDWDDEEERKTTGGQK